jgi:hypothetical protein
VVSTPLDRITGYHVERGRLVTTLRLDTDKGGRMYRLLNRSLGTRRFLSAVEEALAHTRRLAAVR